MPEISVVLPVYNAQASIERAVRSMLEQTLWDIEIIVIDDGSTDQTAAIVNSIQDSRIRYFKKPHRGVALTMNDGVAVARSPLIARMDADDFSHRSRLESQRKYLETHDVDAVGCQVRIIDTDGSTVESMSRYQTWINNETLCGEDILALRFVELPVVNPTILARRQYFELECRDSSFPEDYDLMLRAAAAGFRFGKVPQKLFDWIDSRGRLTRSDQRYSVDAFMNCRRHHLLDGPLQHVRRVKLWGVGQTGKPWMRWLQDHNIEIEQAIEVSPRKIGQTVHGVLVEHPVQLGDHDGIPIIVAVGASGARALIKEHLSQRGYRTGVEAWFVA